MISFFLSCCVLLVVVHLYLCCCLCLLFLPTFFCLLCLIFSSCHCFWFSFIPPKKFLSLVVLFIIVAPKKLPRCCSYCCIGSLLLLDLLFMHLAWCGFVVSDIDFLTFFNNPRIPYHFHQLIHCLRTDFVNRSWRESTTKCLSTLK